MSTWTVVTVVRRGEFTVLAILEGGYQAGSVTTTGSGPHVELGDSEIATHLIEAESREQAETFVREKYFPPPIPPEEEVPC